MRSKSNVSIINRQRFARINEAQVKKLVCAVLEAKGEKGKEIDVVFTDDDFIKFLNVKYLDRPRPTDVIAFGFEEGTEILGDVVVSVERAFDRSAEFGKEVPEEVCLYVIHGILHLLGYDDLTKRDAAKMRKEEDKMLALAKKRFGDDFFSKAVIIKANCHPREGGDLDPALDSR